MRLTEHVLVATSKSLKCISLTTGLEIATTTEEANHDGATVFLFGRSGKTDRGIVASCDSLKPLLRFYRLDKFNTSCKRVTLPEKATTADASNDGTLITVGCMSGNLYVWDATTGSFLRLLNLGQKIEQLRFTSNYLLVRCKFLLFVYPLSTLALIEENIYEWVQPLVTFSLHSQHITCMEPVETTLGQGWVASGDSSGNLFIWDLLTGEVYSHLTSNFGVKALSCDPVISNQLLVAWENGVIKYIDVATCASRYSQQDYLVPIPESQLSPFMTVRETTKMEFGVSGDLILIGSPSGVTVYDVQTRQIVKNIKVDDELVWFSSTLTNLPSVENITDNIRSLSAGNLEVIPSFKMLESTRLSMKGAFAAVYLSSQNLSRLLDLQRYEDPEEELNEQLEVWYKAFGSRVQMERQQQQDLQNIAAVEKNIEATTSFIRRLLERAIHLKAQVSAGAPDEGVSNENDLIWRIAKTVTIYDEPLSPIDDDHLEASILKVRPNGVYSESLPQWSRSKTYARSNRYALCVEYIPTSLATKGVTDTEPDDWPIQPLTTGEAILSTTAEGVGMENVTTTESVTRLARKRPRLVPLEMVSDDMLHRRIKRRRKILQTYNLKKGIERIMSAFQSASEEETSLTTEEPQQLSSHNPQSETWASAALDVNSKSSESAHDRDFSADSSPNGEPSGAGRENNEVCEAEAPATALVEIGTMTEVKSESSDNVEQVSFTSAPAGTVIGLSRVSKDARVEVVSSSSSTSSSTSSISEGTKCFFIELASKMTTKGAEEESLLHKRIQEMVLKTQRDFDLPFRQLPRIYPLKSIVRKRRAYNLTHKHPISTAELGWLLHNDGGALL